MGERGVRIGADGDDGDVQRLLTQLHPDEPGPYAWRDVRQGARTFVWEDESGRVAGVALATFVHYGPGRYGMLEELVVDADHRGAGVGTALLDACRRWLAEQQVSVVFVSAGDAAAEAFYQRRAFKSCTGPWLYWVPPETKQGRASR
jgi:GNAT superfamily N-acetyltransferase